LDWRLVVIAMILTYFLIDGMVRAIIKARVKLKELDLEIEATRMMSEKVKMIQQKFMIEADKKEQDNGVHGGDGE